jgi:hypothetical protein
MYDLTTKLEINVFDRKVDPNHLVKVASQARVAAVVVTQPELIPHLQFLRSSTGGVFRTVLAVDFENRGSNFVIAKFAGLNQAWTQAEGFDIVLSPRANAMEIKNEVAVLTGHLSKICPAAEIRYCVNMLSFDSNAVDHMLTFINQQNSPRPAFIRIDQALEMGGRDIEEYGTKCLQIARRITPIPLKASTNVTLEGMRRLKGQIARFDVTLKNAETIIAQLKNENLRPSVPAVDA